MRAWVNLSPAAAAALTGHSDSQDGQHALATLAAASYDELGEAFLDALPGGFAVVLHDPARGKLILARDGVGDRSVSYALSADAIAAAWNDADLLASPRVSDAFDPVRWAEYFANVEVTSSRSFFAGIRIVLPGEMLIIEPESLRKRHLRRPRLDLRLRLGSWEEYVERFAGLLDQAVRRQILDVGNVAVMMSGGLDSTPIAALAARHLRSSPLRDPGRVLALSWQVDDIEADERALVEATAAHADLDLEWVDCRDALPYSDLSHWPLQPSSPEETPYRWFHQRAYERAASRGLSVVLTGFSGDSLYTSARRWAWHLLAVQGPGPMIDRLRTLAAEIGWKRTIRSHVLSPLIPRAKSLLGDTHAPYLTPGAVERLAGRPWFPEDILDSRRPQQAKRLLALLDAQGGHRERYFLSHLGLDARTPLRDLDLVEFVLASPDHLLRQGTETRPVLRAAIRGLVPESVRLRKGKASFYEIAERGIAAAKASWAGPLLRSPDALWRPYVEERDVERWLLEPVGRDWGMTGFFQCVNAELWRLKRAGVELGSLAAK